MRERDMIRYRLNINHLSYAWLIEMLRKRGIATTSPILSGVLTGTRTGPSCDRIISESISILDMYEQKIGDGV